MGQSTKPMIGILWLDRHYIPQTKIVFFFLISLSLYPIPITVCFLNLTSYYWHVFPPIFTWFHPLDTVDSTGCDQQTNYQSNIVKGMSWFVLNFRLDLGLGNTLYDFRNRTILLYSASQHNKHDKWVLQVTNFLLKDY